MGTGIKMEILTGMFWKRDSSLLCTPENGADPVNVETLLEGFRDRRVKIVLHHFPASPQEGLPGWGSCFWGASGKCPAGHAEKPDFLVNVGGEGVLRRTDEDWFVELDGGTLERLPLDLMEGHRGRLAAVVVINVEEFKKGFVMPEFSFGAEGPAATPEQVESLGSAVKDLRDLVGQFKSFLDSSKER